MPTGEPECPSATLSRQYMNMADGGRHGLEGPDLRRMIQWEKQRRQSIETQLQGEIKRNMELASRVKELEEQVEELKKSNAKGPPDGRTKYLPSKVTKANKYEVSRSVLVIDESGIRMQHLEDLLIRLYGFGFQSSFARCVGLSVGHFLLLSVWLTFPCMTLKFTVSECLSRLASAITPSSTSATPHCWRLSVPPPNALIDGDTGACISLVAGRDESTRINQFGDIFFPRKLPW